MPHPTLTPTAVLIIRLWLEGDGRALRGRVVEHLEASDRSLRTTGAVGSVEEICELVHEAVARLNNAH
jgi:hypothetical protein